MCYPIRRVERSRSVSTLSGFDIYSLDGYREFEIFWNRPDFSPWFVFWLIGKWAFQHAMTPKRLESLCSLRFEMYPGTIGVDQAIQDLAKLLDLVSTLTESTKGRLVFS